MLLYVIFCEYEYIWNWDGCFYLVWCLWLLVDFVIRLIEFDWFWFFLKYCWRGNFRVMVLVIFLGWVMLFWFSLGYGVWIEYWFFWCVCLLGYGELGYGWWCKDNWVFWCFWVSWLGRSNWFKIEWMVFKWWFCWCYILFWEWRICIVLWCEREFFVWVVFCWCVEWKFCWYVYCLLFVLSWGELFVVSDLDDGFYLFIVRLLRFFDCLFWWFDDEV